MPFSVALQAVGTYVTELVVSIEIKFMNFEYEHGQQSYTSDNLFECIHIAMTCDMFRMPLTPSSVGIIVDPTTTLLNNWK